MCAILSDKGAVLKHYPPVISCYWQGIFLTMQSTLQIPQGECTRLQSSAAFFCKRKLIQCSIWWGLQSAVIPWKATFIGSIWTFFFHCISEFKTSLKLVLIAVKNQIPLLHWRVCHHLNTVKTFLLFLCIPWMLLQPDWIPTPHFRDLCVS